jgi:hypothetical protein
MPKYLRPRRGTFENAYFENNIVLKKGEMFLCMYNDDNIGKGPGSMYIGDGASSFTQYNHDGATYANAAQPFLIHPMIYNPIFANTNPQTSNFTRDAATAEINSIGNGSGSVTLPSIISSIKAALCKHANSINRLTLDVEDAKGVQLTQAQYNALSTAQKNNGRSYYITDGDMSAQDAAVWNKVGTADLATTATSISGAINEFKTSKVNADYYLAHLSTCIIRAGTYITTVPANVTHSVFSNAKCNELLGVTNSSNANTIVYFTNGDHSVQGNDVIGTYHNGSSNGYWCARLSGNATAVNYRFNYIIF